MTGMRLVLAILLTLLVQVAFVQRMAIFGIRPDLTILLLVFLSLRRGPVVGTLAGFFLGAIQDLLVPQTLGMNMLAKSVVGYAVGKLSGNLLVEGPPLHLLLVGISVLLHDLLYLLVYTRLDIPRFLAIYFTHALPTALYTAAVAVILAAVATLVSGGRAAVFSEESGRVHG